MKNRIFIIVSAVLFTVLIVGCDTYYPPEEYVLEYVIVLEEEFHISKNDLLLSYPGFPSLEFPNLVGRRLNDSDIKPLKYFTEILYLGLQDNEISDISVLAGMTKMKVLSLQDNNISDISVLAGMTDLMQLSLENNQVNDVSVLLELSNLTHLHIKGNPLVFEQVEELRQALPDTEIFSDHPPV